MAWPISGVFSICLTLSLGELSSAYPVAGAMASWAWKVARGGVGGERKWGWLMGGLTLGGHVGSVICSKLTISPLTTQVLLVTWEIANVIVGTMSLASDYVKQDWHMTLFFLVGNLTDSCLTSGHSARVWRCGIDGVGAKSSILAHLGHLWLRRLAGALHRATRDQCDLVCFEKNLYLRSAPTQRS